LDYIYSLIEDNIPARYTPFLFSCDILLLNKKGLERYDT
jgi:hypothetical protein